MANEFSGKWAPTAKLINDDARGGVAWTLMPAAPTRVHSALPDGTWGRAVREYVGGSVIWAMEVVYGYLLMGGEDGCYLAQMAVLAIEAEHSVLPSSALERVAREAAKRGETAQVYANFILRAYGQAAGAKLLGSAVAP